MTAIELVTAAAKEEEGYLEKSKSAYQQDPNVIWEKVKGAGRDNITKYWAKTRPALQGEPWCQDFVYSIFCEVFGQELARRILYLMDWSESDPWSNFYTPDWAQNFKDHNAWVQSSKAQAGDLVYFKNSTRIHHVGYVWKVERYSDGTGRLFTIEGNTSSGNDVVVSNGGCVRLKEYAMKKNGIDAVAGYGRPNYSLYKEDTEPVLSKGYHDEDHGTDACAKLQQMLNTLDARDDSGNKLSVDGHFGGKTEQALRRVQARYGYNPTGICDKQTWDMLKEALTRKVSTLISIALPADHVYYWDSYQDGYYHLLDVDIWISELLVK